MLALGLSSLFIVEMNVVKNLVHSRSNSNGKCSADLHNINLFNGMVILWMLLATALYFRGSNRLTA